MVEEGFHPHPEGGTRRKKTELAANEKSGRGSKNCDFGTTLRALTSTEALVKLRRGGCRQTEKISEREGGPPEEGGDEVLG